LHHIGGFGSYGVALASGTAVVPMSRFTIEAWTTLADRNVTHATSVPTIIEMLLDAGVLGFESLELLQYGASPIHPSTLTKMIEQLPNVRLLNNYGQTEGSPLTALTPDDHRSIFVTGRTHLLESVGRAVDSVELRLEGVDADGIGEVVARATHLMRPDDDGWLRTGDLGHIDDEGFVFLAGRKGDMIIRGGENIYPVEVEQRLETHEHILEAAVIGIKDVKWGETVKAFLVVSDPSNPPNEAELRAYCRETLAGFKVPTDFEVIEALPRNAVGKLLRRKLLA
jgi:acyl-CoA synthetase (AMP-forming)/AMP-acid ligase II